MKFVTQLIAISPTTALVALCADGTVWKTDLKRGQWLPFPPISETSSAENPVQIGKREEVYQKFYLNGRVYGILGFRTPKEGELYLTADGTVITERGVSPVDWEEKRLILLPL